MHFKKSNDNQSTILHEGSVPYLTFKKLDQAGVRHGFSTRMGGVSEGMFSALNLSYNRGDKKEAVDENFRRISEAIGFDHTKLVFSIPFIIQKFFCIMSCQFFFKLICNIFTNLVATSAD